MWEPFGSNVTMATYIHNCESCGVSLDPDWPRRRYLVWEKRWIPWGMIDAFEEGEFGELEVFWWVRNYVFLCPFCWNVFRTHIGGA
jgi:hypothetical protein